MPHQLTGLERLRADEYRGHQKLVSYWEDRCTRREAMESLKKRDGVPFNAQGNLALREWLQQKGVLKKPAKK